MNARTRGLITMVALASLVSPASAQDPRTSFKFDAPSKLIINAVLDSAKAQGLPLSMLNDRINEGIAKGVEGPRIAGSVRALYLEMVTVRSVLGAVATTDELKAAA